MKKTVFLPIVLSATLLASPQKAKAYFPIVEIITVVAAVTDIAMNARPLTTQIYEMAQEGGRAFINFIRQHRNDNTEENNREENVAISSSSSTDPDLDNLAHQNYIRKAVRYEEQARYFGG